MIEKLIMPTMGSLIPIVVPRVNLVSWLKSDFSHVRLLRSMELRIESVILNARLYWPVSSALFSGSSVDMSGFFSALASR